jgi:hypothetical protein
VLGAGEVEKIQKFRRPVYNYFWEFITAWGQATDALEERDSNEQDARAERI